MICEEWSLQWERALKTVVGAVESFEVATRQYGSDSPQAKRAKSNYVVVLSEYQRLSAEWDDRLRVKIVRDP